MRTLKELRALERIFTQVRRRPIGTARPRPALICPPLHRPPQVLVPQYSKLHLEGFGSFKRANGRASPLTTPSPTADVEAKQGRVGRGNAEGGARAVKAMGLPANGDGVRFYEFPEVMVKGEG